MRRWLPALLLLGAGVALASAVDGRGWTEGGTVAVDAARILKGPDEQPVLPFPKELVRRVEGPTVLFYFSPTCPHCQHVAREVQGLSERLKGKALLLGVASGSSTEEQLTAFRGAYEVDFPILVDGDREIAAAMGVRSTPSAMLVAPVKKAGHLEVREIWYPYSPGYDAWVEGRVAGDLFSVFRPGEYLGTGFCGTCHGQEHASWLLSHHAVAWHTLEEKGKQDDPACTGCHVTGAGQPTGWSGEEHSVLVDVGCESCHGPGGPHDGTATEPRSTCEGCHDADHSIAFSYEKGLPLIDHFAITGMTEDAYRSARLALLDGTAPRELLAFPDGATVGAAKCLSCHPTQHAAWAESPHARAMGTLRDEGGDDPSCLGCHATAETMGPAERTASDFRTLEGVGCESCHGPGEAHVAAGGGTDNIQGLGESCPVCVIEAICTSCHTPKWDPDFALEPALDQVKHGGGAAP